MAELTVEGVRWGKLPRSAYVCRQQQSPVRFVFVMKRSSTIMKSTTSGVYVSVAQLLRRRVDIVILSSMTMSGALDRCTPSTLVTGVTVCVVLKNLIPIVVKQLTISSRHLDNDQ